MRREINQPTPESLIALLEPERQDKADDALTDMQERGVDQAEIHSIWEALVEVAEQGDFEAPVLSDLTTRELLITELSWAQAGIDTYDQGLITERQMAEIENIYRLLVVAIFSDEDEIVTHEPVMKRLHDWEEKSFNTI
ncbi:MAG: hypothetical protein M3Q81_01920 [bacterium]|nr:hypothetical protein [bacterium]